MKEDEVWGRRDRDFIVASWLPSPQNPSWSSLGQNDGYACDDQRHGLPCPGV